MSEPHADTLASENLLLIAQHLATKDDFRALESTLESKLAVLEAKISAQDVKFTLQLKALHTQIQTIDAKLTDDFDLKLAALKSEIVARVGGMVAAAVAATAAIVSIATAVIKLV